MGVTQNLGSSLLGTFVAPLLMIFLAERYGWRHGLQIAALPGFVMCILLWKFVKPDSRASGETAHPRLTLIGALSHRNVALCALIAIAFVAFFLTAMTFVPLYLIRVRGLSASTMAWLIAVLGIASTANSFIVPWLSDRYGRKPLMLIGSAMGLLVPLSVLFYPGGPAVLGVFFLFGWAPIALFPLFMGAIPAETVGTHHAATVIGIIMAAGECIGGVFMPAIAGAASDHYGLQATMWILAGLCVIALILSCGLRETLKPR